MKFHQFMFLAIITMTTINTQTLNIMKKKKKKKKATMKIISIINTTITHHHTMSIIINIIILNILFITSIIIIMGMTTKERISSITPEKIIPLSVYCPALCYTLVSDIDVLPSSQ